MLYPRGIKKFFQERPFPLFPQTIPVSASCESESRAGRIPIFSQATTRKFPTEVTLHHKTELFLRTKLHDDEWRLVGARISFFTFSLEIQHSKCSHPSFTLAAFPSSPSSPAFPGSRGSFRQQRDAFSPLRRARRSPRDRRFLLFSKTEALLRLRRWAGVCLRRDEQQVGQQVRDVVYPCAPVCVRALPPSPYVCGR